MADKLEIVISALNQASSELNALKTQLAGLGETTKSSDEKTKGFNLSLTDLKSGIDMAVGSARMFADVAKQAFDFTAEGAGIIQTTTSFEGMGLSLEALQRAAGGTIDDMTLMSGALTLMAGAGENLEPALANALPQLLEIARAAKKLNPDLGETAFMFESIATGVKRSSSLHVDNLGLIVNQTSANEAYADALGKSVEQLTDEEKKIAFLNETLRAGNTLIEQAGGNVESYTDTWAALATTVENMTDTMKANAAEGVQPLVSRLAEFTAAADQNNLGLVGMGANLAFVQQMLTGTTAVTEAYRAKLAEEKLAQDAIAAGNVALTQGYSDAGVSLQGLTEKTITATEKQEGYTVATLEAAAGLGEMSRAAMAQTQIEALSKAVEAGTLSQEEYTKATGAILTQFGLLTAEELVTQTTLDKLRQDFIDGKIGPYEFANAVTEAKNALDKLPKETTVTLRYQTIGTLNDKGGAPIAFAAGGFLGMGGTGMVGEAGPELIEAVPGGVRVTPLTQTTHNTYNLTNNFNGAAGMFNPVQDVALLRQLFG